MIRTAAYYRAQRRGFAPGYEWEDWLAAEAEVSTLAGSQPPPKPRKEGQKPRVNIKDIINSTSETRKPVGLIRVFCPAAGKSYLRFLLLNVLHWLQITGVLVT